MDRKEEVGRLGRRVLAYGLWAMLVFYLWQLGLALGIGNPGMQFSFMTRPLVHVAGTLSLVATGVGVTAVVVGSIALLLNRGIGRTSAIVGLWAFVLNAALLGLTTFLWNLECRPRMVLGVLSTTLIVFVLAGAVVAPAIPLLKTLRHTE